MWNDVARFALIVVLGHRNRRERASFVIGRSCLRRTVWALILLFVVDPGVLPGALALSVYIVGVLGRLDAEVIENLDPRPLVALRSCGAGPSAVFWYGVMPALAPQFVALSLYRWEVAIRETTVVGVVGAGGLGLLLDRQLASLDYSGVAATLLALMALTLVVDLVSAAARRAINR